MNEQSSTGFPGFHRPLTPLEVPISSSFGPYCGGFEGGHDLGPNMCLSMQMKIPAPLQGSAAYGFGVSGPAIAIVPGLIFLILLVAWLGFVLGFYRARSKAFRRRVTDLSSPDSYNQWRSERNTTILTFILVISGIAFFAFGVSGSIELEIPYAKVITSTPGIVVIFFGYMIWSRKYSFRRNRGNEDHPMVPDRKADSDT